MRVHFSIWLASASAVESRSIGSGTIALSKKYMIRASATKNIMPRVAARRVMPMTILQFDGWLSYGLSPQRFQDIMVQPPRHCPFGRLDVCCGKLGSVPAYTARPLQPQELVTARHVRPANRRAGRAYRWSSASSWHRYRSPREVVRPKVNS